jgi:ATP-dependent DNA helicase RecG
VKEGQEFDRKSLRVVIGKGADFSQLAQHCVCFANGTGGQIAIGIEANDEHPPAGQRIEPDLLDRIRKRVGELTVNVEVHPEVRTDQNGGEFIVLAVSRSPSVASGVMQAAKTIEQIPIAQPILIGARQVADQRRILLSVRR